MSLMRDRRLADRLSTQVRSCCQCLRALLICKDGRQLYPGSILLTFRKTRQRDGRTQARLFVSVATVVY